jgi:hypothetical protein
MTSDQRDDSKNKFRQAFRLFGEAAGEVLREGINRIDASRRSSTNRITEPMRQAGAQVLRNHGVDKLLVNPEGTPASSNRSELILRDLAAEVFEAMRYANGREGDAQPDATQAGQSSNTSASAGPAATGPASADPMTTESGRTGTDRQPD